jgi:hypothetical protein
MRAVADLVRGFAMRANTVVNQFGAAVRHHLGNNVRVDAQPKETTNGKD